MFPSIISPYFNTRDEMSIQDGLIFKGERVVVPRASRSELLRRIHSSHLGVNGCLNRARECLYWPGMTADIKNYVSTCEASREYEQGQVKETIMSPETPNRPWQRVAADLFEFERRTYLVTSDYYSDFFELEHLRSPSSVCVIRKLKAHFARHGIPEQLVTHNGSQFTSRDFLKFWRDWDFEHLTSSPHHSQGNGKAESAVKKAKKILRKCRASGSDAFLAFLDHRNTPPASVQVSPAQRLFNRRSRSLLPMTANLLAPQAVSDNELCRAKLEQRKQRQAQDYNRSAVDVDPLRRGDVVRLEPFQLGRREWQKGIVLSRLNERSYEVETPHHVVRRNRVHLRKTNEPPPSSLDQTPAEVYVPIFPQSNELPTAQYPRK